MLLLLSNDGDVGGDVVVWCSWNIIVVIVWWWLDGVAIAVVIVVAADVVW